MAGFMAQSADTAEAAATMTKNPQDCKRSRQCTIAEARWTTNRFLLLLRRNDLGKHSTSRHFTNQ